MGDDPAAHRDRALLLPGYAGAFRRSELGALDVENLKFSKRGLYVWIVAAKNDPHKKGRELYVPLLPAISTNVNLCQETSRGLYDGGPRLPALRATLRGTLYGPGASRMPQRRRSQCGSIKRVTGQRSNAIVLDHVAATTLDDEPPLLEIVSAATT